MALGAFGIQPGQMIDEYKIIGKIGRGGMATVYKAYQASMDRYVAIKILSFQLIDSEEFLGRFKQEARLIARLEHTNILPVYAYGEDHGIPYLVMRFLNAGTLKDYLDSKITPQENKPPAVKNSAGLVTPQPPLTLDEIDGIFSQLTDALGYAHQNGVIHRDIKPSNVLLDQRGTVFLTDFGIAKLVESAMGRKETVPQFTATGAITGTPDYMSPEQAQGLRLDQRSDIYSLGIMLFEMLTGKVPFDAETPIAVIMKQISEPPPPPSVFNPAIPPALESVVVKALEKSPAARYASMNEFLFAWKNALVRNTAPPVKDPVEAVNAAAIPSAGAALYGKSPTPIPATPTPVTPAGGVLHALEDDSFPGTNTPPKIKLPPGVTPSSPGSPAWNPVVKSSSTENSSPMNSVHSSPSTIDEDNKFLLKNLQLSKTASSREGLNGSKASSASQASQAHQFSKRILWIAGGVALAILVIIVLATALNVFDFIQAARQIPAGRIP
jgi:eukaryotic-like serine/threonine-protein kinase